MPRWRRPRPRPAAGRPRDGAQGGQAVATPAPASIPAQPPSSAGWPSWSTTTRRTSRAWPEFIKRSRGGSAPTGRPPGAPPRRLPLPQCRRAVPRPAREKGRRRRAPAHDRGPARGRIRVHEDGKVQPVPRGPHPRRPAAGRGGGKGHEGTGGGAGTAGTAGAVRQSRRRSGQSGTPIRPPPARRLAEPPRTCPRRGLGSALFPTPISQACL